MFGVGAWLATDETGEDVFLPFWIVGAVLILCYGYCASQVDDDDDHGCGFGNYDEGPGNMGCMMTTCAAASVYVAGVVVSLTMFGSTV
eukprot:COSAG02_NODE_5914_length_3942_cov_1.908665_1_plen_88_part_00